MSKTCETDQKQYFDNRKVTSQKPVLFKLKSYERVDGRDYKYHPDGTLDTSNLVEVRY